MLPPAHTKIQVIHHTSQSDDNDEDDSNDADDEEERNLHRYANKKFDYDIGYRSSLLKVAAEHLDGLRLGHGARQHHYGIAS